MDRVFVIATVLSPFIIIVELGSSNMPPNVDCQPLPAILKTDISGTGKYSPWLIQLIQCQGADSLHSLTAKRCVPTEDGVERKSIQVLNIEERKVEDLLQEEHTKCKEVCRMNRTVCVGEEDFNEDTCACECKLPAPPIPSPCEAPFEWRSCHCTCTLHESDCPSNMELREKECGCFCKIGDVIKCSVEDKNIDLNTCECLERNGWFVQNSLDYNADRKTSGSTSFVVALVCVVLAVCIASMSFWFYRKRRVARRVDHGDAASYNTF